MKFHEICTLIVSFCWKYIESQLKKVLWHWRVTQNFKKTNLVNFDMSTQNSQNLNFDWFLLCKIYNVWSRKVPWSYLWWHWRLMQNLKKNWLVVGKVIWGIWHIFTRVLESLKNLNFNGIFLNKVYNVWAKKTRRVMFHETEECCKIWTKIDLWFGKWHEEFGKLLPEHSKVSKLRLSWDPFIQSRKCMSLIFTEELCVMTMKDDAKFEEELTCLRIFMNFDPTT